MGISRGYVSEPRGHRPVCGSCGPKADILIDNNGRACLSDFGFTTIAAGQSIDISSWVEGGTYQWMSPELINPESCGLKKIRPTKESDCYALGMVVYEVLSGRTPFAPWKAILVVQKVPQGERPKRPEGEGGALFTDSIWRMLELCWKHQPHERISAEDVLPYLEGTSLLSLPPSDVGGVVETDTDGQLDFALSNSSTFSLFHRTSQAHHQSPSWCNRPANCTPWQRTPDSTKRLLSWCNKFNRSTGWR